jgi:hypothetical protein
MTTATLSRVSAGLEVLTGIALMAIPGVVARVLLGVPLLEPGIAVGRLCGIALFSFGLACWSSGETTGAHAIRALFVYNLLAAFYLGYLRVGAGFISYLLWPACLLHALLGALLARPAFDGTRHG